MLKDPLKDDSLKIDDIIVYKGNFYAVDRYGETIKYDSSFNKTNVSFTIKYDSNKVSSSLFNEWGTKKRPVESGGQLFLVDLFLDTDDKRELRGSGPSWDNPMEIKIHRLDEEQHEWIAVHTLDDRIFFAGDDCCFSVSSLDFGDQCRGNCIYYENGDIIVDILGELPWKYYDDDFEDDFYCGGYSFRDDDDDYGPISIDGGVKLSSSDGKIDKNDLGSKSSGGLSEELKLRYRGLHGHHTGIFTLQDGKLGSLSSFLECADIFWPPPSWLNTEDHAASSDAHN
ncbi:uncharacterized protein LOC132040189 [Lycium ferocissimum]|uniref:uncharacterized protein LOC132040189 n=1 Tax=Lycium ferocissimum TaxID=112874 RepID=UPI0028152998|nr:uncharacterized protein LOC132040189 [Lycium ferocissimum]